MAGGGALPQYVVTGQPAAQAATQYDWSGIQNAIAGIESSGNYNAIGPETKGDRPWGRYQVMGKNVPVWTERHLGVRMTPEQFLQNAEAQDAVFRGEFGNYINKYGLEGAAQAWIGGPGSVGNLGAKDILGTSVGQYGQKFMAALGQNAGTVAATNAAVAAGQQAAAETAATEGLMGGGLMDLMMLSSLFAPQQQQAAPALAPTQPYVAMTPEMVQATSATPSAYVQLQRRRMGYA
jgi:hypothetical protein